jgi:acylglycerol lipase
MTGAVVLASALAVGVSGCATPPSQKLRAPNSGAEVPPEVEYWRGNFKGAEGVELYEQGWRPSGKARAVVVFLHGLKDHSSRYRELGIQLAHRGIAVYAIDLRGHGYSEGVRDHIDSLDNAVEDLNTLIGRAHERQPGVPLFLAGQGFGAALAAVWSVRHPGPPPVDPNLPNVAPDPKAPPPKRPLVTGLILSSPLLRGEVKGGERLGTRAAATFAPQTHSLDFNLADWTSDPSAVAELKSDPLIYEGQVTASTARELLRASDELQTNAAGLTTPVLVMFGGADKIASVEVGKAFEEKLGAPDKSLQVYDGLYHDLFHEKDRKQVVDGMLTWLNTHANLPPEPEPAASPAQNAEPKAAKGSHKTAAKLDKKTDKKTAKPAK